MARGPYYLRTRPRGAHSAQVCRDPIPRFLVCQPHCKRRSTLSTGVIARSYAIINVAGPVVPTLPKASGRLAHRSVTCCVQGRSKNCRVATRQTVGPISFRGKRSCCRLWWRQGLREFVPCTWLASFHSVRTFYLRPQNLMFVFSSYSHSSFLRPPSRCGTALHLPPITVVYSPLFDPCRHSRTTRS